MPTIRATCIECGDVELRTPDVTVRVCIDDGASSYQFRCPACAMSTVQQTEPQIVDLLVASGVALVQWKLPSELFERREGQLFTHDDIIDFHALLEDPADPWLAELEAAVAHLD